MDNYISLSRAQRVAYMKQFQWDYGQRLVISGIDTDRIWYGHFANTKEGICLSSFGTVDDGKVVVKIPDILLMGEDDVNCYLFSENLEGGTTIHMIHINIVPRAKPETQNYSLEDLTEISQLAEQLSDKISDMQAALDSAHEKYFNYSEEEATFYIRSPLLAPSSKAVS